MKIKFYTRTSRTLSVMLFIVLAAFVFSSCSKNEDNTPDTNSLAIAVTNAASTSTGQDVYFGSQILNTTPLLYTQTVGYVSITGNPTISFKNTGTSDVNASTTTTLLPGKFYNAYYTDDKTITVYENERTPPQSAKARVRFINLTTAIGSSVDFGIAGGNKIVTSLTYKSASAYQDVDPLNGFSLYTGGSSTVLLSIPAALSAGGIYTIYISGTSSATVGYKVIAEN